MLGCHKLEIRCFCFGILLPGKLTNAPWKSMFARCISYWICLMFVRFPGCSLPETKNSPLKNGAWNIFFFSFLGQKKGPAFLFSGVFRLLSFQGGFFLSLCPMGPPRSHPVSWATSATASPVQFHLQFCHECSSRTDALDGGGWV